MSLSKQLLILISALFLVIFSVNFALSVGNIKAYLEGESQTHAQDTATSLGLSLSPYMTDPSDPVIKTMVAAIFDMGYYQEIRLVDAKGGEILALSNEVKVEGVPGWFIDFLPMSPAIAQSEISSGWTMTGVVYVTVNSAFAYAKLYSQAKTAFYYSLATFAVSVALLVLLLRITLASLQRIARLALEIADGHFDTVEELPWTLEVRSVASAMNTMSRKIAATIATLNDKLEVMGASMLRDDLTGLYKHEVFETDLKRLLAEHGEAYLVLIKIDNLAELVNDKGGHAVNQLLKAFAGKMQEASTHYSGVISKSYRFYGSEFAMLVATGDLEQLRSIAETLSAEFAELGKHYAKTDLTHIGVARLNPLATAENVLQAAQEAYEQARLIGANAYYVRPHDDLARDTVAWRELVFDRIDSGQYSLEYGAPVVSFETGGLLMEEVFTRVYDQDGREVAIGPFVSIAEKFGKIADLDKGVILRVLANMADTGIEHAVAVNLSADSITNAEFRLWLEKLIKSKQKPLQQLVFAFSAYAVAKDVARYAEFIGVMHQWGGRVMIKRFETHSLMPEDIKSLKPDFIRLARKIGEDVSNDLQKQEFVRTLQQIAALLDIALLAENVSDDADYRAMREAGISGASR